MEGSKSVDQRVAANAGNTTHAMLLGLVHGFRSNTGMSGRALRDFAERAPQRFVEEALQVLREEVPEAGRNYLIGLLMERDALLKDLADPAMFAREKALELGHVVHRTSPAMELQLLRQAIQDVTGPGARTDEEANWGRFQRALEILGSVGNTPRVLPILSNLLRSSSANVRAKAAPLVIRTFRNAQWLRDLEGDADSRVRANAVEAYLTAAPLAEELPIIEKLTADPDPRVATTSLIVLSQHGPKDVAEKRLLEYCTGTDPKFRAAAAWAMGKTGNASFLPQLQRMVREEQGDVKRMAFLACVALRKEKSGNEAA